MTRHIWALEGGGEGGLHVQAAGQAPEAPGLSGTLHSAWLRGQT